jgi:hypothetical protein
MKITCDSALFDWKVDSVKTDPDDGSAKVSISVQWRHPISYIAATIKIDDDPATDIAKMFRQGDVREII